MAKLSDNLSNAEQLVILGALAVGGYMLYTLIQTLKKGPGQVADWVGQEWDDLTSDPSVDPNSGISLFSWLP